MLFIYTFAVVHLSESDVAWEANVVGPAHLLDGEVEGAAHLLQAAVAGTVQRRKGSSHSTCIHQRIIPKSLTCR